LSFFALEHFTLLRGVKLNGSSAYPEPQRSNAVRCLMAERAMTLVPEPLRATWTTCGPICPSR